MRGQLANGEPWASIRHCAIAGSVTSCETNAGKAMPLEDILTTPCDVLIPAAIPGVLDAETARQVQCRIVVSALSCCLRTAHAVLLLAARAG